MFLWGCLPPSKIHAADGLKNGPNKRRGRFLGSLVGMILIQVCNFVSVGSSSICAYFVNTQIWVWRKSLDLETRIRVKNMNRIGIGFFCKLPLEKVSEYSLLDHVFYGLKTFQCTKSTHPPPCFFIPKIVRVGPFLIWTILPLVWTATPPK